MGEWTDPKITAVRQSFHARTSTHAKADFNAAAVLITFGALLGKTNPTQV